MRHTCSLDEEEIQSVYTSFGAIRHTEPPPVDNKKLDPSWGQARSRKRRQQPSAADACVSPPLRHVKEVDGPLLASVIKWGAISKERAQGLGAHGPVYSVLLQPVVSHVSLRQRLFKWIPVDYFPVPGAMQTVAYVAIAKHVSCSLIAWWFYLCWVFIVICFSFMQVKPLRTCYTA